MSGLVEAVEAVMTNTADLCAGFEDMLDQGAAEGVADGLERLSVDPGIGHKGQIVAAVLAVALQTAQREIGLETEWAHMFDSAADEVALDDLFPAYWSGS